MVDNSLPVSVPRPSTELQNLGRTDQPQNQSGVQDVEVNVRRGVDNRQNDATNFEQYLNSSQTITVLTNQKNDKPIFDPVQDITNNSVLQGYGNPGESQPT
ncbi:hypothetical protein [Aquibium microcysteis]|uniref:hypothetical protein n=1 Tax=Aquibium microcysteis TaxID=675281 RepID=UPI00165D1111|nr:hypothetical protein [Aquibium microcysteis]